MQETEETTQPDFLEEITGMKKESQETAAEASKQRSRTIYHHRRVKSHRPAKTINTITNTFRPNQIHTLTIRDVNFGERTAALMFEKF